MKMNATTEKAIRALAYIYMDGGVVTSKTIAEAEGISHGVLIKILGKLHSSGILRSHQGRGSVCGGFSAAANLENVTIYDIIKIMEGDVCIGVIEHKYNCPKELEYIEKELFRIKETVVEEFKRHTIYDLVQVRANT